MHALAEIMKQSGTYLTMLTGTRKNHVSQRASWLGSTGVIFS